MSKRLLVLDDDESGIRVIRKALEPLGYDVEASTSIRAGIKNVGKYKLVLLGLMLPDCNGIDALKEIKVCSSDTLVIIVTTNGHMESAIDAMKEGAYHYLKKPFDIEELKIVVDKAFKDIAMREELLKLRQSREDAMPFQRIGQIIGKSRGILKVFREIGRVAPKDVTVLISGEIG